MIKVALTGADGMVGSRIVELLRNKILFIPIPQTKMDITDNIQVVTTINSIDFDYFLHLAAFTNVDAAEKNKELAYRVNAIGTKNIFDAVSHKKKRMIYISTGFVFDGENPPYSEDSPPRPVSVYGETKFQGEQFLKNEAMIIRFDYPYRNEFIQKNDFVRSIIDALKNGKKLQMVTDSLITPTFVDDISQGIDFLIHHYSPEIYHLVGSNSVSPYEAGIIIAKTYGLDTSLITGTTYFSYFSGKAKRPQFAKIISTKNSFIKMKAFEEGLQIIYHKHL